MEKGFHLSQGQGFLPKRHNLASRVIVEKSKFQIFHKYFSSKSKQKTAHLLNSENDLLDSEVSERVWCQSRFLGANGTDCDMSWFGASVCFLCPRIE